MVQITLFNLLVFPTGQYTCLSTCIHPFVPSPWPRSSAQEMLSVCIWWRSGHVVWAHLHIVSQKEEGEFQTVMHKVWSDSSHCTHSPASGPGLRSMSFSLSQGWSFLQEHLTLIFTSKQLAPSFLQLDSVPLRAGPWIYLSLSVASTQIASECIIQSPSRIQRVAPLWSHACFDSFVYSVQSWALGLGFSPANQQ